MNRISLPILVVACAATLSQPALAQSELESAVSTGQQKVADGKRSQDKINDIVDAQQAKLIEYRALLKQQDGLEQYNEQLSTQVKSQEALIQRFDGSITQVAKIERQMLPLTTRMVEALSTFVALDLPFHETERLERIAFVQDSLQKADINVAEKFRQVLEAYQIENDYGRKIDTYQRIVEIDGQQREVDILRMGRVALVAQTRDATTTAVWDHNAKQWLVLDPGTYRNSVRQGIKMAKKQASIDLVSLPIPAPTAAETN